MQKSYILRLISCKNYPNGAAFKVFITKQQMCQKVLTVNEGIKLITTFQKAYTKMQAFNNEHIKLEFRINSFHHLEWKC